MELIIVSGLSGAGKSQASKVLEDMNYYCVDNLPVALVPQFAQYCMANSATYERVALVTDIRGGISFDALFLSLKKLDEMKCAYTILFFEAGSEILIHRYKETRRRHPLQKNTSLTLSEAVQKERTLLEPVRNRASYIIDTSSFTLGRLKQELQTLLDTEERERSLSVEVTSFGFKKGVPEDADLVFDVRFLPNPYYIDELKQLSGLDEPVRDFVFSYQQTTDFVAKVEELLLFSLPYYIEEGKTNLIVAIGCTGGRHRSVAIAQELATFLEKRGFLTNVRHRDLTR